MIVSPREPFWSRAAGAKATWAAHFAAVRGFSNENVSLLAATRDAKWVEFVPKVFAKESTGHSTGLSLAMMPRLLELFPEARWYLLVDDDTIVVPHQLQQVVRGMDFRVPTLAGKCAMTPAGMESFVFIVGGSGILASRAFIQAVAPRAAACRRKFSRQVYGDTRVTSCGREVFNKSFVKCRREFWNGGLKRVALNTHWIPPGAKVATMHNKNPLITEVLYRYLERDIAAGRAILWKDIARVARAFNYSL